MLHRPAIHRRLILLAPALLSPAACAAAALVTPAQGEGPFYPVAIPADADADLRQVAGARGPAQGMPLALEGTVRRSDGRSLPGAQVEIWQADHAGIYLHPGDRLAQRDAGFQGFGRAIADGQGRYAFRTIRPGRYPGRTPHIHMRVLPPGGGQPLVTQLYFPDAAENLRDFLFSAVPGDRRGLLLARLDMTDQGQRATFDVILA